MSSRSKWVGVVALVGALTLVAGGGAAIDDQGKPKPRSDEFVQAGRFTINKTRIDYVERGERGQLYVYFTSNKSAVLNGDAAQVLLHALGSGD
jgi:hypothetical protein